MKCQKGNYLVAFKTNIEMKLIKGHCLNNKKKATKVDQKKKKINNKSR